MNIMVTGGAGFIGSHIVDELIQKGHQVTILDNLSTGKKENINAKATFVNADLTNDVSKVFDEVKPELVIHTAGQVMLRDSLEDPIHDAKTNILGTINVLEASRKSGVKKIIYTSTGGARYGNPTQIPTPEEHKIDPTSPYGISKHTAEHYIWMYNQVYGIDYLIFCFGNVYGPRDDPKCKRVTALFLHQIMSGIQPKIFGDGNQTRDFIYVRDLAACIVNSMNKNPEHKLFNLANGKQISVNEIFNLLKKITNYDKEAGYIDAVPGEVRDICLDISKAQKELGWDPEHSFEEGLKETYKWFLDQNKEK